MIVKIIPEYSIDKRTNVSIVHVTSFYQILAKFCPHFPVLVVDSTGTSTDRGGHRIKTPSDGGGS